MKYNISTAFPTYILTLDLSEEFTEDEIDSMTDHIDNMIEKKIDLQIDELTPLYQSKPVLFHEESPKLFSEKLQSLFIQGCGIYVENILNFSMNQKATFLTHANAWFYCGWAELNETQNNPWHNHNPCYLSGVFYLKNKGNPNTTGTEFHDPRGPWSHTSQMQFTPGVQRHLAIFPGWLYHKVMQDPENVDRRYTIACNAYAAVR
jgi:hypothetical protein